MIRCRITGRRKCSRTLVSISQDQLILPCFLRRMMSLRSTLRLTRMSQQRTSTARAQLVLVEAQDAAWVYLDVVRGLLGRSLGHQIIWAWITEQVKCRLGCRASIRASPQGPSSSQARRRPELAKRSRLLATMAHDPAVLASPTTNHMFRAPLVAKNLAAKATPT